MGCEAFGSRVRTAMAVARVPASRVASECGVTVQAVQKWKDGTAFPTGQNLLTFCRLTGASVEWLTWPNVVDIRSTLRAPDGVHAKELIRAVIEDMASDGVLRVAPVSAE